MSKATILLITLAALGLGSLIGVSLVNGESPMPATSEAKLISEPPAAAAIVRDGLPQFRFLSPDEIGVKYDEFGSVEPSTLGENFIGGKSGYRSETVTIMLEADAGTEYKALMKQGDAVVYSWETDGDEAYYDFHGHDSAFGEEFFTRYGEGESITDSGMIVAPYTGQHGWYWLNLEDHPVTITLNVAGFYARIIKIKLEEG